MPTDACPRTWLPEKLSNPHIRRIPVDIGQPDLVLDLGGENRRQLRTIHQVQGRAEDMDAPRHDSSPIPVVDDAHAISTGTAVGGREVTHDIDVDERVRTVPAPYVRFPEDDSQRHNGRPRPNS